MGHERKAEAQFAENLGRQRAHKYVCNAPARAGRLNMIRRQLGVVLALSVITAMASFSSTAFAKGTPPVKTSTPFTAEYNGGEYFGENNTLHCTGIHKTNSVKFPGSGRRGGKDVERCTLSKGEKFPSRWQTPGQPINIDDNFWVSDFDGQEVPFNEDLPSYGVTHSVVSAGDNSFSIKVIYPNV